MAWPSRTALDEVKGAAADMAEGYQREIGLPPSEWGRCADAVRSADDSQLVRITETRARDDVALPGGVPNRA